MEIDQPSYRTNCAQGNSPPIDAQSSMTFRSHSDPRRTNVGAGPRSLSVSPWFPPPCFHCDSMARVCALRKNLKARKSLNLRANFAGVGFIQERTKGELRKLV